MKRLVNAYKTFMMVLNAESYCLITVRGMAYRCDGDISAENFQVVTADVLDNFAGQDEALEKFKAIVNSSGC